MRKEREKKTQPMTYPTIKKFKSIGHGWDTHNIPKF